MNRSVPEIIDNMYECCDEYTKYGLNLLGQKYNVKYYFNFHTYNKYFLFIYSRTKNHSSLIEESNNIDNNTNDNQQEVNNNEITNRRYENI